MTRRQLFLATVLLAAAASGMANAALAGDAAHGKTIFQHTCANCHSPEIGVNKVGPSLFDIVGRSIAIVPDYGYSETLRDRKTEWQVWDEAALNVYLRNPRDAVHGVKMFFKGLPEPSDRADVIAYL